MDSDRALTSETSPRRRSDSGPAPDTPVNSVLLTIGHITGAHGLQGEVKVALATDRPEKMADLRRVYLDGSETPNRISSIRLRKNDREALIKLREVNDRNAAERLRGSVVQIRGNQLPPPESDAFFHYQIIGLQAVDESGATIGTVTEIIDAGEVDVYVVTDSQNKQHLFPALHDVVLEINPNEGWMVIRPQKYAPDNS